MVPVQKISKGGWATRPAAARSSPGTNPQIKTVVRRAHSENFPTQAQKQGLNGAPGARRAICYCGATLALDEFPKSRR